MNWFNRMVKVKQEVEQMRAFAHTNDEQYDTVASYENACEPGFCDSPVNQEYYCGHCERMVPLSSFPHPHD